MSPRRKDCLGFFFEMMSIIGISEIQEKKERLNFGNEKAVKMPLDIEIKISLILIFKTLPPNRNPDYITN